MKNELPSLKYVVIASRSWLRYFFFYICTSGLLYLFNQPQGTLVVYVILLEFFFFLAIEQNNGF